MGQSEFFHLGSPASTSKLAEWAHGEMDYESTVFCPVNEGHQRAGKRLPNLSIILPGSTVEDIAWTWRTECFFTDRVLELFKIEGFTGFEVKPVKARFKRTKAEPPRLWELVVTGWAGIAPPESGIKLVEQCEACGDTVYSDWTNPERLIDCSQWDGNDFFMVWPLPRFIFVTNRVAKMIRKTPLFGAVLRAPSELTAPPHVIAGLSPGRLRYWMPEQRARELGEPLGIY